MTTAPGKVFLIGAGPGDVELLTIKAVRCIGESDAILIDSLANKDVLRYAKSSARVLHVGKRAGQYSVSQQEVQSRLIALAKRGHVTARIKGGDPIVFARGGEEIEALCAEGIEYEIVPGITAATGVCASLGISLTHRDVSHQVMFLTGLQFEEPERLLSLPDLRSYTGTIVVYMGLRKCSAICHYLIAHGLARHTPAVAVQSGTLPDERAAFAPVAMLADAVACADLVSPVILIIGDVVALSPKYGSTVGAMPCIARETHGVSPTLEAKDAVLPAARIYAMSKGERT